MSILIKLFVCLLLFFSIYSQTTITLSSSPSITLSYDFLSDSEISFTVTSSTQGYVAIGFGSQMAGANIIRGFLSNGKMEIEDSAATGRVKPAVKATQLSKLVSGSRTETETKFTFTRKLVETDFTISINTQISMIWAYGSSDTFNRHTGRGVIQVNLQKCDNSCKTCKGTTSTDCLSCNEDRILKDNSCLFNCDKSCSTCKGTTSTDCLTCKETGDFNNGVCTYPIICDKSCKTCKGTTSNDCLTCNDGFNIKDGSCIINCDDTCLTCNGPSSKECLTCKENGIFNNGVCTYPVKCDISCKTCKGTKTNDCLSCNDDKDLIDNTCKDKLISPNSKTLLLSNSPQINLIYSLIDSQNIEITLSFATQGYISLGFGKGMIGSDIIWCYFSNSNLVLEDVKTGGYFKPSKKETQESLVVSGSRVSSKTECTFRRKLISSDFTIKLDEPTNIVWAYGSSDNLAYHTNKGSASITFQSNNVIQCDASCKTCSGTSPNQCLSCASNLILSNNRCISQNNNLEILKEFTSSSQINSQISLYWIYNTDSTITMGVRWNTGGYIGIGFGNSMTNTDMIIIEKSNSAITAKDYFSKGQQPPEEDSSLSGKNDITVISFLLDDGNGNSIVKFNRKLNTGDPNDYVISQKETTMIYGYSSGSTLGYHGSNRAAFTVNLVEGSSNDATIVDEEDPAYWKAHTIGLLITWSFVIEIPIIIIRFFKNFKYYIELHSFSFLIIDIWTIIIVFIMLGEHSDSVKYTLEADPVIMAHFICGIIVIFLIVLQHIFGLIVKALIESKEESKLINKLGSLKKIHKINGYLIYLLTKATMLLGLKYDWDYSFFVGFLIYYCILIFGKICFETIFQYYYGKSAKVQNIKSARKVDEFNDLIRDIETFRITRHELIEKYPKLKWCLLDSTVYNLANFNHPGGNFIIDEIKGREIGRFFFGGYPLESTSMKGYTHTEYAKSILDQRAVGNIELGETNILQFIPTQKIKNGWSLINRVKLTDHISKFEFSSTEATVKNHVKGVNWFGRHFSISFANSKGKMRLYTTVLSYTQNNIAFRDNIINYYHAQMQGNIGAQNLSIDFPESSSNLLPLIIKRYGFPHAFSAALHDSNQEKYDLQGPMGMGLELTGLSNGTHVIFCGGTGILPFVDLLDYLLKKCIYHVLSNKFGVNTAKKINPHNEDYENTFGTKFKVQLFCSFNDLQEFSYLTFIKELYEINRINKLNMFEMVVRFNDQKGIEGVPSTSSYFDQNFMNQYLVPDQISKIFVCGNPTMNKTIPEICREMNIEKEKIILV